MWFDRVAQLFACRDVDLAAHIDHRRAVIVRDFSRELLLQGRENTNTPLIANNIRGLPGVRSMLAYESARVERSRNAMRFISGSLAPLRRSRRLTPVRQLVTKH